jgi:hypothetical protein
VVLLKRCELRLIIDYALLILSKEGGTWWLGFTGSVSTGFDGIFSIAWCGSTAWTS